MVVGFTGASFASVVPFGFVADKAGDVVLVGRGLERRIAGALPMPLADVVELVSPRSAESLTAAILKGGPALKIKVMGTEIVLRGEGVELLECGGFAFIGAPLVQSLDQIKECGLQLRDFAVADSTPDLLLSMQATKTALSDARKLGEQLKSSVVKAEAAVTAKSQFLAVMSHEIRTPLNGLGSMVDLLREAGLTDVQSDLTDTIDDCARTLNVLLNDVLDLSKVEAGAIELEEIPVCISEVAERVVRMYSASAETVGSTVELSLGEDLPPLIVGDPTRIRQVLSNLVSNAIKFSPDGTIGVEVRNVPGGRISFTVRDTGVGVPEEAQATLFDPFVQADSSTTRKYGGTGLGLSIAWELAKAMGGDLVLVSSSEQGSVFRFQIKAHAIDDVIDVGELRDALPASWRDRSIEGKSVLVVDDNPVNRLVAKRLLKNLGIESDLANDGLEAVKAVEESRYDLVLMDLMMPNLDGIEAAKAIRKLSIEWSELPILAFTAGVMQSKRDEAAAVGMADFLEKPVRLDTLREALQKHAT